MKAKTVAVWASVVLLGLAILLSCGEDTVPNTNGATASAAIEETQPLSTEALKDLDRRITQVSLTGEQPHRVLRVDIKEDGINGGSIITKFSDVALDVSRELVKQPASPKPDTVHFVLVTPMVDQYGNKSDVNMLMLAFPYAELQKVNFDNRDFSGLGLLNLASVVKASHTEGRKMFREFCAEESFAAISKNFCAQLI